MRRTLFSGVFHASFRSRRWPEWRQKQAFSAKSKDTSSRHTDFNVRGQKGTYAWFIFPGCPLPDARLAFSPQRFSAHSTF